MKAHGVFLSWLTALCLAAFAITAGANPAFARTLSIVGFGDSLMAGYELPAGDAFPAKLEAALKARGHDVAIANAGVSGDTTSDGLARLAWSVPDGTDAVILELGANDALRGVSPQTTRENLVAMIEELRKRQIAVLLVGMLAPPNMGRDYQDAFNPIFPDLAEQYGLRFYPFFLDGVATQAALSLKDGMHPNAAGVDVMVKGMLPVVEDLIADLQKAEGK